MPAAGNATSTRSPALRVTAVPVVPEPFVDPPAIVHVNVVLAPFCLKVHVTLATGAVAEKQRIFE